MSHKKEKFFIYAAKKSGDYKGKRLLGVNHFYEGGTENITLRDLVEFLKEKNIELSTVVLPAAFTAVAKL